MGGGVYIASTQNLTLHTIHQTRWDRIRKLDQTDLVHNVTVGHFGGSDMIDSVGPISLGLGHNVISVRPITQTRWDRFW